MKSANEVLKESFGYDTFRPLQKEIIDTIVSGKDAFVLMPTGGGKSLCYQIPALMMEGVSIIISPLISLMKDQVDTLKSHGIKAEFLNSSLTPKEAEKIEIAARNGDIKILYMSPEKCLGSMQWFVQRLPVSFIAIDEAHCVSNWGHDFRPEYKQLEMVRKAHPNAVMMALTATADKLTKQDILTYLGLKEPELFVSSFDRPNLSLSVKFGLKKKDKIRDILSIIRRHKNQSGIIYCTAKKTTEALAGELQHEGIKAVFYHAGMSPQDRNKIQEQFINDDVDVVCATIAFGMGIDKSNVKYVLHYNLPKSIESYYQEIGRGGRDGTKCETCLYFSISDIILLSDFAKQSGMPEINKEKLDRVQEYAEAQICRRKILLNYFGENLRDNCNNCDVCKDPPKHFDGTIQTQMALSAVVRASTIGVNLGVYLLINTLRGSRNAEILEKKLDTIKTYGIGKNISFQDWNYYILQMIQIGLLEIHYDQDKKLAVTSFGEQVLKGSFTIDLVKKEEKVEEVLGDFSFEEDRKMDFRSMKIKSEVMLDKLIFEQLRMLRKEIARNEDVPPYVIFHDSTLHEMVEKMPVTREEMLLVSGVSASKFDKYGTLFLNAIIATNPPKRKESRILLSEAVQEAYLSKCIQELQEKGISVSGTAISKILLGTPDKRFDQFQESISFYGALGGEKLGPKALFELIRSKVDPIKEQIENSKKEDIVKQVQDFLKECSNESLTEDEENKYRKAISDIIVEQNYFAPQENQLASRAGQHWTDLERTMLDELISKTSNIEKIASIMSRGEKSILYMIHETQKVK